jgi:hypothetical protein
LTVVAVSGGDSTAEEKKNNTNNNKINWRLVVKEQVIPALQWFKEQGIIPTLRTLFYRLVSLEVIPNTKNSYSRLSRVLVRERKECNIAWDAIADEGRIVVCNFEDRYERPERYIQRGIDHIKEASSWYKVPRWYGQKHYVEVWIEKQALANTFESFLEDRDIRIVVNKGYASWSFLYENTNRLLKIHREYPYKHFHILYFGDFDPSGEYMDRHMNEGLYHFGFGKNNMNGISLDFKRIAITQELCCNNEEGGVRRQQEHKSFHHANFRPRRYIATFKQIIQGLSDFEQLEILYG